MKLVIFTIITIFIFSACSSKQINEINSIKLDEKKVNKLYDKVVSLSKKIDKKEAKNIAKEAISYSKELAIKYKIETHPLIHNTLINLDIKERGLCYHYANDLLKYLDSKFYKSFKLKKVVANEDEYFEHTSLIILRDDIKFEDGIILDAWRDAGELFFSSVKNDKKYVWELK